MNVRRGMFRIWVVISLAWICGVSCASYVSISSKRGWVIEEQKCFDERTANPNLGLPGDCLGPHDMFSDLLPRPEVPALGPSILSYVPVAATPPLVIMAMWFVGTWIVSGFRRRPGQLI
jgi:hypothetical protein